MLPPPIKLKKDECVVLIALEPDNRARSRYLKIGETLAPFGPRLFEYIRSSVMLIVTTSDPASLASALLPHLARKDLIFIVSDQDNKLVTHIVCHRPVDDDELRKRAAFWRTRWVQ